MGRVHRHPAGGDHLGGQLGELAQLNDRRRWVIAEVSFRKAAQRHQPFIINAKKGEVARRPHCPFMVEIMSQPMSQIGEDMSNAASPQRCSGLRKLFPPPARKDRRRQQVQAITARLLPR
jgi:hypothetical protein